jgi:ubiquinone/menaquinone biosynthesis C-methylase UbiE
MDSNEARVQWENAAPGWAKWEAIFSQSVESATEALLDAAGIETGSRVLDLACGAGNQTLAAAKRAGTTGRVVANDISQKMLDYLAKNAAAAGLSNIDPLPGSVQELDIEPAGFDAVISRFGVMLIPEPGRVLSKVFAALKSGGNASVMVFSVPQANPFFIVPMQILLKHAGKSPPPPGAPGLFALAAPGLLEKLFSDAGFENPQVRSLDIVFRLPSADQTLMMIQEAFGAYRAVISDCTEETKAAAWAEVREYLGSIESGSGIETPAQVLVGSASKPVL